MTSDASTDAPTKSAGDTSAGNSASGLHPAGLVGAFTAALAWGASSVIAKVLDMDSLAIVVYRFGLASIAFLIYMTSRGIRLTPHKMRLAAPAGIALAIDVALFFSAVKETTVANATVIGALQPVLMLVVARRFLGERVTAAQVFWSLVAVGGVVFLIFGSSGLPGWSMRGDLLAVGALVAWTTYMFLVKTSQTDELSTTEFTSAVAIYTAVLVLPLGFLFGQDMSWPSTNSWLLIALMTFGSGLLAHPLMNWSLARIPVSIGSAMTLLVPVSASVLAWAFVDERITAVQMIGIAITLVSLAALTREQAGRARHAVADQPVE